MKGSNPYRGFPIAKSFFGGLSYKGLTALAEVCLRSACAVAAQEVCRRHHLPRLPGQMVVLAMGKLGGGEIVNPWD
jgi:glutamine synthetase adenylyltransferase